MLPRTKEKQLVRTYQEYKLETRSRLGVLIAVCQQEMTDERKKTDFVVYFLAVCLANLFAFLSRIRWTR